MNQTTTYSPEALEPWRSKAFIATHYSVSARTIERWIYDGCPFRRVGSAVRLRLSDVERYLEERDC